ncbi:MULTISPECIES: major capsid protein [unclassified Acinetobacter]|uniref:major capsid protein n=1 Tax=unclassified Acinetobacter TaxID=196816 RepID=UPI0015D40161|nr:MULTISPECIES: major capsid protein [unclassified Acinetobacter]
MAQTFQVNGAPMELLDIGELTMVHQSYEPLDTWLLDRFFPNLRGIPLDKVPVGELSSSIDVAPLVASHLPGQPFNTETAVKVDHVLPAYLKPKNQVTQSNNFDLALVNKLRQAGFLATGSQVLSEQDKWILGQIETVQRNRNSVDNRKVLMAAEYLTTGKMLLESDNYTRNEVSYSRNASLSFNPTIAWDQPGAKPYKDVKTMAQLIIDNGGGTPNTLLLSNKNWGYLKADPEFQDEFVKPNAGINIPFKQTMGISNKPVFHGTFDNIEIWTLDATYNHNGSPKRYIPSGYVGLHADTNGFQAQCKIKHIDAGGQPLTYFDKQWQPEDPGGIVALTESAPLLVPSNKNGWCGGTAFSA